MQIFAEQGNQAADLTTLNKCWMYLHVIFLLDICNASGTEIESKMWSGVAVADTHNYRWPRTTRPTPGEWTIWQRSLQQCLNLGRQQQLPLPLGKWSYQVYNTPGWFMDSSGEQLF